MRPISSSKLRPVLERISTLTSEDLDRHKVWKGLANLSKKTTLTGIEAHPSGVYDIGSDQFEAVATIYVTLDYGKGTSFANSFPAEIKGTMQPDNQIKIDDIKVDPQVLDFAKS